MNATTQLPTRKLVRRGADYLAENGDWTADRKQAAAFPPRTAFRLSRTIGATMEDA